MNYKIVADMSIDIDRAFAEENDIQFIPMEYSVGEEIYHCKGIESDEMMHHYYDALREKKTTKTSQVTPYHYQEFFQKYVDCQDEVLYICLSSGLSNTYESARMAVRNLKEDADDESLVQIEVVDSLGATGGMGLLAEMAVRNKEKGMTLKENAAWLREHAGKILYWFKVEDLMYLLRGGRVSATTAVLGTALNIKPILTINGQGKLDTIAKKRGNKQVVKYMVQKIEETMDESICDTVYICCADCKDDAENLKAKILEKRPNINVKITMLSPIIGAHTGPDMFAIIYFSSENR